MTKFKDNILLRQHAKGDLSTILGVLDELNSNDAIAFIKWTSKKAHLFKDALLNIPYTNLPHDMARGDIVLCDLGINIPHEFSDMNTGKHFVIFWVQQGHNVVIIPITSKCSEECNPFLIPIGKIPGLPQKYNYAKLDSIRSVSLRRISRISGLKNGKIHCDEVVPKINNALLNLFVNTES